jgi:microcystin-dependent protein
MSREIEGNAMKRLIYGLTALAIIFCASSRPASAQANEPFIGEIQTFAFNFCPNGWAPLNGQLLSINQNQALFSLLGTIYGGDGKTTFALPTAKPVFTATGATMLQCISLFGVFPSRN